jgi:hypothetical protein
MGAFDSPQNLTRPIDSPVPHLPSVHPRHRHGRLMSVKQTIPAAAVSRGALTWLWRVRDHAAAFGWAKLPPAGVAAHLRDDGELDSELGSQLRRRREGGGGVRQSVGQPDVTEAHAGFYFPFSSPPSVVKPPFRRRLSISRIPSSAPRQPAHPTRAIHTLPFPQVPPLPLAPHVC